MEDCDEKMECERTPVNLCDVYDDKLPEKPAGIRGEKVLVVNGFWQFFLC